MNTKFAHCLNNSGGYFRNSLYLNKRQIEKGNISMSKQKR